MATEHFLDSNIISGDNVWETLWNDDTYSQWTTALYEVGAGEELLASPEPGEQVKNTAPLSF